ncbi:MAG TPA: hypothetical protein VGO06_09125 [Bosea sp. (in: a-proteobacteria)]|jgi:hypothetical protein|uniref:hypothetical protein n=1 Tax=Bosea sp. (in: a-proteobacteria) TaxID=1871050 RepID=UPI002E0DFEB6|nr:hypothetical protein [Bosea sp. (in: a-proteobacteria)]
MNTACPFLSRIENVGGASMRHAKVLGFKDEATSAILHRKAKEKSKTAANDCI